MNIAEFRAQFPDLHRTDEQWETILNALAQQKQPRQPHDANAAQRQKIQALLSAQRSLAKKKIWTDRWLGILAPWRTLWTRYAVSFALWVAIVLVWDARWSIFMTIPWDSHSDDHMVWIKEATMLYDILAYGESSETTNEWSKQTPPLAMQMTDDEARTTTPPQGNIMPMATSMRTTPQSLEASKQESIWSSSLPTRGPTLLEQFPMTGAVISTRPLIPPTIASYLHPEWTRLAWNESWWHYEFDFWGNLTANARDEQSWRWSTYDFLVTKGLLPLSWQAQAMTYEDITLRWQGGVPYQAEIVRDEQGNPRFFTAYLQTFEHGAGEARRPSIDRITQAIQDTSWSCPSLTGELVYSTDTGSLFLPSIRLWCDRQTTIESFLIIPYEQ